MKNLRLQKGAWSRIQCPQSLPGRADLSSMVGAWKPAVFFRLALLDTKKMMWVKRKTLRRERKLLKDHATNGTYLGPTDVPFKKIRGGAPGWHSRLSIRLQPGHDLAVREFKPRVGLWADGSESGACFRFCVSLSLCPSPVHALSLSVPKINKC